VSLAPEPAYLAHEAARLVGVNGDRIGQWARWGHIDASISRGDPHVYSFADVRDALLVHLRLATGATLEAIRSGQEVIGEPFDAEGLLRAGGFVARELGIGCIEVDPARCLGRPVVRGTRIPVQDAVVAGGHDLDPAVLADLQRWWEAAP
jgi:hypothetical protein